MATRIEQQIHDWHDRKYGDGPVNLPGTYRKLGEEFGELGEALMRFWVIHPDRTTKKREAGIAACIEAADIAILCLHIIRGIEKSDSASLAAWMAAKLEMLCERLEK
jgi:polyferredoxin